MYLVSAQLCCSGQAGKAGQVRAAHKSPIVTLTLHFVKTHVLIHVVFLYQAICVVCLVVRNVICWCPLAPC